MARRQYRLSTEAEWQSMFGKAILAFVNTSGSGRKLTFRSLEMMIRSIAGATSPSNTYSMFAAAGATGEELTNYFEHDSSAILPATVKVRRRRWRWLI